MAAGEDRPDREAFFAFLQERWPAFLDRVVARDDDAAREDTPGYGFEFPGHSTDKEPALWTQFWVDQGLKHHEVAYAKGLGDGNLGQVSELLADSRLRILGLVFVSIPIRCFGIKSRNVSRMLMRGRRSACPRTIGAS